MSNLEDAIEDLDKLCVHGIPTYYNGRLILTTIQYKTITYERYHKLEMRNQDLDFICDGDYQMVFVVENGKQMIFG